jgi:hypothetical protein
MSVTKYKDKGAAWFKEKNYGAAVSQYSEAIKVAEQRLDLVLA